MNLWANKKRGITRQTFIWARLLGQSLSRTCFCVRWKRREFDWCPTRRTHRACRELWQRWPAEGIIVNAFYSGFGPMLAEANSLHDGEVRRPSAAADEIYKAIGKTNKECTDSENLSVSLGFWCHRRGFSRDHLAPGGHVVV